MSTDKSGFIFAGVIKNRTRDKAQVELFLVESNGKKPVGQETVLLSSLVYGTSPMNVVDQALQQWVFGGRWINELRSNPELKAILGIKQTEQAENLPWYRRTYRFIPEDQPTGPEIKFVLTTDKSDLGPREMRMLEIGEEAFAKEEAAQHKAEVKASQEAAERDRKLHAENSGVMISACKAAFTTRSIPPEVVKKLFDLGMQKPSTSFRRGALYPGEDVIIWYEFKEGTTTYSGYLGFDTDRKLISIDERHPTVNSVYLG